MPLMNNDENFADIARRLHKVTAAEEQLRRDLPHARDEVARLEREALDLRAERLLLLVRLQDCAEAVA
jgi:hypothetical protein